jgi:ribosomal protein S18 acetylase RimI-like enzyme
MNVIIFPLLLTNPPLNIPIYKHELNYYSEFAQLQGQCNFQNMKIVSQNIYSYGVVGIKNNSICTSAVVILPKTGSHYEIYSLCTSLLARNKGYASEMMTILLDNLQKFYQYVWIGVDANTNENIFKNLIKFYLQLGFIYYTSFNIRTPLGIAHPNGFVQLVKRYTNKANVFTKFYNQKIVELAWNCAKTKTTPLTVCIKPDFIHNIFKKYGHLPYEIGGSFTYNRHYPQPSDKYNPLGIEYQELLDVKNINQGTEEFLAVLPPKGVYNFHTHPVIGTNLFKTTFAWPSMADVNFTLVNTFHHDLLLHIVAACEGFYTLNVTDDTLIALRHLSTETITTILNNIQNYLYQLDYEKQRSVFQRYFQHIGWTTNYDMEGGPITSLKHKFISPSGTTYNSLKEAVQSDEYKQKNLTVDYFKQFVLDDAKNQIKYLLSIVDNMTLDKFISGGPKKPIIHVQHVSYTTNTMISTQVYTFKPYDIPIFKVFPLIDTTSNPNLPALVVKNLSQNKKGVQKIKKKIVQIKK